MSNNFFTPPFSSHSPGKTAISAINEQAEKITETYNAIRLIMVFALPSHLKMLPGDRVPVHIENRIEFNIDSVSNIYKFRNKFSLFFESLSPLQITDFTLILLRFP